MAQPLKSNARSRRGMTLPETLIAAGVLTLALAMVALAITSIRTELKQRRTRELLVMLDAALEAYHHSTGTWPESAGDEALTPTLPPAIDRQDAAPTRMTAPLPIDTAEPVIAMLAGVPAAREVLERLPQELRVAPEKISGGQTMNFTTTQPAWGTIQDAWGQRLHCLTANSPATVDRQAVAANGGKPIFVSAGQNGEFHNREGSEAADNLRGDELPR